MTINLEAMDPKQFILHLLEKYQNQVCIKNEKDEGGLKGRLTVTKKNSFKLIFRWIGGYADLFKRNSFGGYDPRKRINIGHLIRNLDEIMSLPEVKKTQRRFNRNLIVQNLIGREIIEKIGGRIVRLASNESGNCEILCNSFRSCMICPTVMRIWWNHPDGTLINRSVSYNILDPSFNPDLLIKVIKNFSDCVKRATDQLRTAWDEAENLWHLESKNHESE